MQALKGLKANYVLMGLISRVSRGERPTKQSDLFFHKKLFIASLFNAYISARLTLKKYKKIKETKNEQITINRKNNKKARITS
jgi:hypothetical protein